MNIEKEIEEINTYRTIIKATCLKCGRKTTNAEEIQIMNDLDCVCVDCGNSFVKWETEKGFIITAEILDFEGNEHLLRDEYLKAVN